MIIPSSVISIGDNFIDGCIKLNSVVIPSDVKNIGILSFHYFYSLKEFIIPPSVTKIYEKEFNECTSLEKIEIPSSVTHIEKYAFSGCTSLKQITIPPSITSIEDGTFSECTSLKLINIPDSVTYIGFDAFYRCNSLVNIMLPASVNKMGSSAFKECTFLKKIIYKNDINNIEIIPEIPKKLKIVLFGPTEVGKTCFSQRIYCDEFVEHFTPTIAVSYYTKSVIFQERKIKIDIWDTPGQKHFQDLAILFIPGIDGSLVIFDINNPDTLKRTEFFFEELRKYSTTVPLVLVGNKCDLEHNVSDDDIKELEKKYKAKYFEVSVKNDYNIKEVIDYLITEAAKNNCRKDKDHILNLISNNDKKDCAIY